MKQISVSLLIPVLVIIPLVIPIFGQQGKDYTLSVDVDLVLFNVTVLDKKGHVVPGLPQDKFHVYEDGRPEEIKLFYPEDVPATVGLVIDNSGSMLSKRPDVVMAAKAFVADSDALDELFVVNFNDRVFMGLPSSMAFASSTAVIQTALDSIRAEGRTALYDGIATALRHLDKGTKQKKALVVLSDGGDNFSRNSLDDVLRMAEQSSATIYTIGIYDPTDRDRNPKVLRRLAKVTGGEAYMPHSLKDLNNIWRRIAGGIRSQYTVGYFSTNSNRDGTFRNVKILVDGKDGKPLDVRTRPGYLSPE